MATEMVLETILTGKEATNVSLSQAPPIKTATAVLIQMEMAGQIRMEHGQWQREQMHSPMNLRNIPTKMEMDTVMLLTEFKATLVR